MMLFAFVSCKSQKNITTEELTFETLKKELIFFLKSKNELDQLRYEKLISGESTFNLSGLFNNKREGKLINGIYAFSVFSAHSKGYFVIIEDNSFKILDFSSREGLDQSIKHVLDFSERSKYCVSITSEIISRLVTVYYNVNKSPLAGFDINCQKGITTTDDLP